MYIYIYVCVYTIILYTCMWLYVYVCVCACVLPLSLPFKFVSLSPFPSLSLSVSLPCSMASRPLSSPYCYSLWPSHRPSPAPSGNPKAATRIPIFTFRACSFSLGCHSRGWVGFRRSIYFEMWAHFRMLLWKSWQALASIMPHPHASKCLHTKHANKKQGECDLCFFQFIFQFLRVLQLHNPEADQSGHVLLMQLDRAKCSAASPSRSDTRCCKWKMKVHVCRHAMLSCPMCVPLDMCQGRCATSGLSIARSNWKQIIGTVASSGSSLTMLQIFQTFQIFQMDWIFMTVMLALHAQVPMKGGKAWIWNWGQHEQMPPERWELHAHLNIFECQTLTFAPKFKMLQDDPGRGVLVTFSL